MGRLKSATVLVAGLALGLTACDYVSEVNNAANRAYHESRWQATTQSCASGEAYLAPSEPPVPRVCAAEVEPAYPTVAASYHATKPAWANLVLQAESNLAFSAEMLGVLASKNTISIEQLAPQITTYVEQTGKGESAWRDALEASGQATANLQSAWATAWPGNGLQFGLLQQIAQSREADSPEVSGVRQEALEHYHQNEFSRLAEMYLGFEPAGGKALPASHVPQGCAGLAEAHLALETALLVRYSLDQATQQDLGLISKLAKVDLSRQGWDEIRMKKGRYGEKRVLAAIARLKLLKYLDTLVTDSLGIMIRDVGLEWDMVWPGHRLETNIFEFAGVPKVVEGDW